MELGDGRDQYPKLFGIGATKTTLRLITAHVAGCGNAGCTLPSSDTALL